ncbi:methyltransferase domain-containing protein [Bizionia argentinensis JUB59]|uniref:Methyltransferase domain-containing protein n=1 Tax=Bizionia argentinensis JUB59 TaxID=1046627 RepID=G2EHP1_9FLAO|nr:RsmD family RNA methyltransferase [Bizionia argentinensis]EGV42053.1 methyltransferase domain-containing protein [Bizionia argentinensis JUB59]
MRIVSGQFKGRRITAPRKLPVRPTTDMAKEALFNILNNLYYLDSISVIDLFSGTGNISYEFASRGTEDITCVDGDAGCIQFINETAETLNIELNTIKSDVFSYLAKNKKQANVIFADPPYDFPLEQFSRIPELVFKNNLLLPNGVLIVEHSKYTPLSELEYFSYSKSYGNNLFSFFEMPSDEEE